MSTVKTPSPSRTYVAICNKTNFDGHYFRKFTLPNGLVDGTEHAPGRFNLGAYSQLLANTHVTAVWYFLNVLNSMACINGTYTWEEFSQELKDQDQINAEREAMYSNADRVTVVIDTEELEDGERRTTLPEPINQEVG